MSTPVEECSLFEWARDRAAMPATAPVAKSAPEPRPSPDCVILPLQADQTEALAGVLHRGYQDGRAMFGQLIRDQHGAQIAFATLSRKTWARVLALINQDGGL